MTPSREAVQAIALARQALSMARAAIITAMGLFSLLAALCVSHRL